MKFEINPKKIFHNLLIIILFLLLCHVIVIYLKLFPKDIQYNKNFISFFDFDWERNLPTFCSTLALFASAVLLLIISVVHKKKKTEYFQWLLLSFIFVFLSLDEFTSIHEQLETPTRNLFNTSGILYSAWYIPYGVLLFILMIVYAKFLFRLSKKVRFLFIIAGLVFVLGAIGFESISGYYQELIGRDYAKSLIYNTLITFEELFEMCGVAIFIYALLIYLSDEVEYLGLKIT